VKQCSVWHIASGGNDGISAECELPPDISFLPTWVARALQLAAAGVATKKRQTVSDRSMNYYSKLSAQNNHIQDEQ